MKFFARFGNPKNRIAASVCSQFFRSKEFKFFKSFLIQKTANKSMQHFGSRGSRIVRKVSPNRCRRYGSYGLRTPQPPRATDAIQVGVRRSRAAESTSTSRLGGWGSITEAASRRWLTTDGNLCDGGATTWALPSTRRGATT